MHNFDWQRAAADSLREGISEFSSIVWPAFQEHTEGIQQVAAQHRFAAARTQGAAFDYHSSAFQQYVVFLALQLNTGLVL